MDVRLFFATFGVIFLAELGDKTQLAAMAAAAGSKAPWSVFAGASVALVLSTLIATLFGATLQRICPPQYLKGGAAILFFVFGTILLISAILEKPATEVPEVTAIKPIGIVARTVFAVAHEFEAASAEKYRTLADSTTDRSLSSMLRHLADEEDAHLLHLNDLGTEPKTAAWQEQEATPAIHETPTRLEANEKRNSILEQAIAHERSTNDFYSALASAAPLPAVRHAFERLAEEELSHLAHLEEFRDHGTFTG